MLKRITSFSLIAVMTLSLVGCGALSIAALKGAVSAFGPLISILISRGTITQAKADQYTADANKLIDGIGVLETDWTAAKTKGDKFVAIQKFANVSASVANDFAAIPQLALALAILNTTLGVLEQFYGNAPAASPGGPKSEKELAAYVKAQSEKLKAALHP